jgi:hypothetical protein
MVVPGSQMAAANIEKAKFKVASMVAKITKTCQEGQGFGWSTDEERYPTSGCPSST